MILTLFGDQWTASIPVLRWLAIFGAATAATMFASTALIAADRAAREVRMTAKVHVLRVAIIASTAALGIVPLAMGLSGAALVEIAIVTAEIRRTLRISLASACAIYSRAAALTVVSALPAAVLVMVGRMDTLRLPGLLLLVAMSAAAWITGLLLLRHPLAGELRALAARVAAYMRR